MKTKLFCLFIACACTVVAQEAVHSLKFRDDKFVTFTGARNFTIYPLSERAIPVIQANTGRPVIAADYIVGIKIKTDDPANAAQMILGQIAENTGEKLGPFWNSQLNAVKPAAILTGVGKYSVWTLVITPVMDKDYLLTLSYLIEKSNEE